MNNICENCMKDYQVERNGGTPFPSFTVLGGLIGGVTGLLMGSVVLIPAGLLLGFSLDVTRCDKCGSDRRVHRVMLENELWDTKIYRDFPLIEHEKPKQYIYDELEGKFTLVQNIDDSPNTFEIDTMFPDYSIDYDVSFDVPDTSFELGSFDMGGFGDGGFGDGGDSEGSASDGGTGGGE